MKWTKERVLELAKNFKTRKEFTAAHPGAVAHAYKHGYKDEAFAWCIREPPQKISPVEIGTKYNRLTLTEDLGMILLGKNSKNKARVCMFKCDCGNPNTKRISLNNVKKGTSKSCGECRYYEKPDEYGEVETACEVCGTLIKTSKNRIRQGRGRFCSQQCLFASREIEAAKANIGFKHPDGFLTVKSFARHETQKTNKGTTATLMAICECECGREYTTHWVSVQFGRCLRCDVCQGQNISKRSSRINELKNRRFGRLLVVGYKYIPGNNGNDSHYLCDCDCGTKKHPVKSAYALESGHTTSCGCWEGHGRDTYQGFKSNREHREQYCEVYFVEVNGGPIQKFGISDSTHDRGIPSYGNYTTIYRAAKNLNRAKCWCVEQVLLYETLENFPSKEDVAANGLKEGYLGGTELRIGLDADIVIKRFDYLVEQASMLNWRAFYERYITNHQRDLKKQQLRKAIKSGLLPDNGLLEL